MTTKNTGDTYFCPENPPDLIGNVNFDFKSPPKWENKRILVPKWFKTSFANKTHDFPPTMDQLYNIYTKLADKNAVFHPSLCKQPYKNSKVAILIKYRNRDIQLRFFFYYMLPILIRQQLEFKIYVIEQIQDTTFNRAKLINAGYDLIKNVENWDCYTFHDVDLVLENDKMLYRCEENGNPRHLSVAIDKFNYKSSKDGKKFRWMNELFGGVLQVTGKIFEGVNGYSNKYWGWGGEDDDFYNRVMDYGEIELVRPDPKLARYKMFSHTQQDPPEMERFGKLKDWSSESAKKDGWRQTDYKVIKRVNEGFFERIIVDIGDKPDTDELYWKEHWRNYTNKYPVPKHRAGL